jgi:8-oxo-dGTP pyrophosphatase MutT (NUDIX family)
MPSHHSLRQALERHAPHDPAEQAHRLRMTALLEAPDPWSRRAFSPGHFTASAFVLDPDRDALLLVHHRKLGRWLQPGGHVEPSDDDLAAAARREVLEEVGLDDLALERDGIFDLDVHSIPALGDEPEHEHFDVRFLFRSRSAHVRASEELRAARWFPLAEVDAKLTDASVLRALSKLGRW